MISYDITLNCEAFNNTDQLSARRNKLALNTKRNNNNLREVKLFP